MLLRVAEDEEDGPNHDIFDGLRHLADHLQDKREQRLHNLSMRQLQLWQQRRRLSLVWERIQPASN